MMRNPIVITSLEEDFRKIGLIKTPALTESTESTEAETVEEETEEVEETTEGEETDTEELAELKKQKLTRGGFRSAPTRQGKKEYKAWKRTPAGRRALAKKRRDARKAPQKKAAKKLHQRRVRRGLADSFDPTEAMKSFANAAIIAEKLKEAFESWVADGICESAQDANEFAGWAVRMEEVAEQFAEIATALHEATELDSDDIEAITEAFNDGLDDVLDAVEMYEENETDEDSDTDSLDEDVDEDVDADDVDEDDEGND